MEFSFLRVGRTIATAGAMTVIASLMCVPMLIAQDAGAQQPAGQAQKNWKDRAEYDLYIKITQTQDAKARLQLLNTWQDKYPQTDFQAERSQAFIATLGQIAQSDPSQRQALIDKCEEVLRTDPKNFTAAYYVTLIGPQVGGNSPAPTLVTQVQGAAHSVLDEVDSMRKKEMSDAEWTKAKNQIVALAHTALGWAAAANKDNATAENEYKASLEANPDQGAVSYQYAKLLQDDKNIPDDKKYPIVLFEYARAAQYTGPGAVPASAQPQLLDYFKKVYGQFHGSAEGQDQVLAQAKTSALPPDGFNITSVNALAQQQANDLNTRIQNDPGFKIWYGVKQNLQDKGDSFFDSDVKGFELPGETVPSKTFTGTVISIDPPDRPTRVVLGVEDPTKPDATLVFSTPLPPEALDKIKVGQKLDFSGVADSFTKDPYMLTFTDPTIPGVKTTTPPKKGTSARRRRG